jgi:amidase
MSATGTKRFLRTETTLFFDPDAEPLGELRSGERVIVETADSICGIAKREAPRGFRVEDIVERLGGACPVTGPFAIEGARSGGVIEIQIHRIDPHPASGEAWTGIFAGFGALQHEAYGLESPGPDPELRLVPYADGVARLPTASGEIEIPLRPFIGTAGVAPRREKRMSFSQAPEYLGDVDIPQLTSGARLVLPANVDGALFALGDAHAAQGDGEFTGAAIEIESEVELTVRAGEVDEYEFVDLPQINTDTALGSVAGYQGIPLADCIRAAARDLVERLVRYRGFQTRDAYLLLGQVARVQVGNMIDPFYSTLVSVDRQFID